MSLACQDRGLFIGVLGGLGVFGCRPLGGSGSALRICHPVSLSSTSLFDVDSPPELYPIVHQGYHSCGCSEGFTFQGCHRTRFIWSGLLQSPFRHPKGHWWSPVIDLFLNRFVRLSHFRMETAQSVLQSLRSGDWLISLDLQDAYLQAPGHPQSRRCLRFCIGSQVYQFRFLCFGLSSAPLVFTRVMAPVSSTMHRAGYLILRYLDDWLVLGSSQLEITRARDFLLLLCADLGIQINFSKSSLQPAQRLDYLGMTLQSTPLRAFPTQARIHKVLCLIDEFSSSPEQPLSLWRSLLGMMSSLSTLILGSRLRMRSLQHRLLVSRPLESPTALVSWDASCRRDLQWWSVPPHLCVGVDLSLPRPDLVLYTDASDTGWGALLGFDHLSGWWSLDVSLYSINHRELLAIFLAIRGCLPILKGQTVSLFTDNTSALSYLRKEGGTRSSTLNEVAQATLRLCEASDLRLLPQFVPDRLNVLAHSLSRRGQVLGSKWTLHQEVCRDLFRLWPVTVDLFATSLNHRLQVYFSPMADPQAAAVDALVQSWDNLQVYAFLLSACSRESSARFAALTTWN